MKVNDVGRALDSMQNDKFFQSYVTEEGSENCIILAIQKLPGENTIQIIKSIKITDDLLQEGLKKKPSKSAASFVTIGEPDIAANKKGKDPEELINQLKAKFL